MDWVLGKVVDQSDCGASLGNTKITDLIFPDDTVIFAESLEVLVMALEALHEEAKPLGFEVSWLKTKVQVFGVLLDETVQSVHACGEDIQTLESFTYLGFDEPRTHSYRGHQLYPPLQQDGKELESWCSEKQRNKLLRQAVFPAISYAAWLVVFVKYNTIIPSSAAVERLFSQGSDIMKANRASLTSDNFDRLVFMKGNMDLLNMELSPED
ncbi:hypothetical protein GWK47_029716 [Chionoecetes opilio]|uniref:HAT C-terminal dimerisation domain-containing protein n=1 Tax=Chionoecetes opilio TaxID=41210 RepID=A0A8J5D5I5_CHIOP|nr:hypothetical protein GWK47_029716 [Chionoecetes opilio]